MISLTTIAGFSCNEGQAAANLKQVSYTIVAIAVFWYLSTMARRSKRYGRVLFWLTVVIGAIVIPIVLTFGPFFYNGWGCHNIVLGRGY